MKGKGNGNQGPVTYCVKISTEAKRDGAKTAKDPLQQTWYGGHSCFYTKNRENVFFFFPYLKLWNVKYKILLHDEGTNSQ